MNKTTIPSIRLQQRSDVNPNRIEQRSHLISEPIRLPFAPAFTIFTTPNGTYFRQYIRRIFPGEKYILFDWRQIQAQQVLQVPKTIPKILFHQFCAQKSILTLHTEHIQHYLQDISYLGFLECLHLLKDLSKGLHFLLIKLGHVTISESSIGFGVQGQPLVWINPDLSSNIPADQSFRQSTLVATRLIYILLQKTKDNHYLLQRILLQNLDLIELSKVASFQIQHLQNNNSLHSFTPHLHKSPMKNTSSIRPHYGSGTQRACNNRSLSLTSKNMSSSPLKNDISKKDQVHLVSQFGLMSLSDNQNKFKICFQYSYSILPTQKPKSKSDSSQIGPIKESFLTNYKSHGKSSITSHRRSFIKNKSSMRTSAQTQLKGRKSGQEISSASSLPISQPNLKESLSGHACAIAESIIEQEGVDSKIKPIFRLLDDNQKPLAESQIIQGKPGLDWNWNLLSLDINNTDIKKSIHLGEDQYAKRAHSSEIELLRGIGRQIDMSLVNEGSPS